jgi:hypothetical protein
VQGIGLRPRRMPDGAPLHCERHRPEQAALCRVVPQHPARSIAHTEAGTRSVLPWFIKDAFDTSLECGILARSSPSLRCGE